MNVIGFTVLQKATQASQSPDAAFECKLIQTHTITRYIQKFLIWILIKISLNVFAPKNGKSIAMETSKSGLVHPEMLSDPRTHVEANFCWVLVSF